LSQIIERLSDLPASATRHASLPLAKSEDDLPHATATATATATGAATTGVFSRLGYGELPQAPKRARTGAF
jgi:hypothetical protein